MSSSSEPPHESLTITSAEQYRALGHPLRHRLLFALGQRPATISQLAVALDSHKGNVAHHLKVLREAGLVAVTETRQVRGGTEQYYQRTARRFDFPGQPGAAQAGVLLQAVADEMTSAAGEPLLMLRNVRLTEDQAGRLANTLSELAGGLEDAGDGEARYGLLIGLYQPRQPDPAGPDPSTRSEDAVPG
jgi:DNA-binding transcriptional ArsR family regulator